MARLRPGGKAVITGAAQGIGLATARRLASEGMIPILVDLPGPALDSAAAGLPAAQAEPIDVADRGALQALADRLGPVDLLMNNAATRIGRGFDAPHEDWRRTFDVNLWGVIHGVEVFLPAMQSAGTGIIVNTGSKQGITNPPGHPVYNATKAALKSYTESLAHHLHETAPGVTAHLLIPGWTREAGPDKPAGAWSSDQVAGALLAGLEADAFYILCPDNDVPLERDHNRIRWAGEDIIENRPALSRWHPAWSDRAKTAGT
ncbi:MAG: SDR family NAD(P)-dependent oxidoreductase [Pseudomonadota bacterium]